MQTNIFFISLLFCSLTLSFGVKHSLSQGSLTESQIINYDLSQIQDCNSYANFKKQLDDAIAANSNAKTILSTANETIFEAKDLMNVIINYENARVASSSFLLRSERIRRISSRKADSEKNKLRIAEVKNELQIINDTFDLLSEEGKKNVKKLNDLYILLSSSKVNETPLEISNQIMDLLDKIDADIVDALNNTIYEDQKLENKKNDSLDLAANLNC